MFDALIVANSMTDKKRVLEELELTDHSNVFVLGKNQKMLDGVLFKRLILAPNLVIENKKHRELIQRLEYEAHRYIL